mgnify:CR=1 FL=1
MTSGVLPIYLILFTSVITALPLIYVGWQRSKMPGSRAFGLIFLSVAWWTIAYMVELSSNSLAANQFWFNVKYLGTLAIPLSTFWFTLRYLRYKTVISSIAVGLLLVVPLITLTFLWAPSLRHLMLTDVSLTTAGAFSVLQFQFGPWFWINVIYSFTLSSISFLLLLNMYREATGFQQRQILLLCLGISIPWLVSLLAITRIIPAQNLDLPPLFFVFTNMLVGTAILRERLLEMAPINLEFVARQLEDYIILLDGEWYIVGMNDAAQHALGKSLEDCIGRPLTAVFPDWGPSILSTAGTPPLNDIVIEIHGETRYFDHKLLVQNDRPNNGRALILHDITRRHQAELAYRESEASYRAIFETTGTATVIVDADKTLRLVNEQFEKLSGYPREEIEGQMKWTQFVHAKELPRMEEYHRARREKTEEAPASYEFTFLNRQEEERQILLQANMVPDSSRSIISLLDITRQIETSKSMQQQNQELSALARLSAATRESSQSEDIFYLTMKAIVQAIGAEIAYAFTYQPQTEMLELATSYPRDRQIIVEPRCGLNSGITGYVARTRRLYMCPNVHQDPLSNMSSAQIAAFQGIYANLALPLFTPDRLIGVMHVGLAEPRAFTTSETRLAQAMVDIAANAIGRADLVANLEAEIRAQTATILEEKEISEAILRNVADGVVMVTPEMDIQYANEAFSLMTGLSIASLSQKSLAALLADHSNTPPWTTAVAALARGQSWEGETTLVGPGQRPFTARLAITPIHHPGEENKGYVVTTRDISQQRALDNARTKFMTNISHELRTPITNIQLHADLLRASPPERHEHYLDVIAIQIDRLHRMFEDILTLSALDSQTQPDSETAVDLRQLLTTVASRFRDQADEAALTFTVNMPAGPLPPITGDPKLILQAIAEIVENAVVYTPSGGSVSVTVEARYKRDNPSVAINVVDTGPGLTLEEQKQLTTRFYRGEHANAGNIPGSGLGLSIVETIMNRHNGRLHVHSQRNQGSTFILEFPTAALAPIS